MTQTLALLFAALLLVVCSMLLAAIVMISAGVLLAGLLSVFDWAISKLRGKE
jgi:hypothetical protein